MSKSPTSGRRTGVRELSASRSVCSVLVAAPYFSSSSLAKTSFASRLRATRWNRPQPRLVISLQMGLRHLAGAAQHKNTTNRDRIKGSYGR